MKLKKLMALAMAGVLAVSMLAGCKGNTINNNDPVDPDAPATGISADVGSRVEALALEDEEDADLDHLTFADDNELTAALNDAIGGAGVSGIVSDYFTDTIRELHDGAVHDRLYELVEPTEGIWITNNSIGNVVGDDGDTETALRVYAISNVIDENTVKQQIARELTGANVSGGNVVNVVDYTHHNNVWNYEYTISVAMSTKTVNSANVGWGGKTENGLEGFVTGAENPTVTFVAVQIVRTATHQ